MAIKVVVEKVVEVVVEVVVVDAGDSARGGAREWASYSGKTDEKDAKDDGCGGSPLSCCLVVSRPRSRDGHSSIT